jgi:four helix bundle protein
MPIAKGSAFEVEYQLLLAKDLKYINEKDYDELNEKIQKIISMLTNLIKSLRSKRKTNKK